ncbi:MAG: FHA domain-containing protein [Pyrinomonadaceae bacterium]
MTKESEQEPPKKREGALAERLLRRVLEGMGEVVDRRLGRAVETKSGLTASTLIAHMNHLIDERVRNEGAKGIIAPHLLKLKIEWGTHSEAPPEVIKDLEHELLAAAIDHINDSRYRTLAPPRIETETDIFTTGVTVDPTFGEFEEELRQQDEAARRAAEQGTSPKTGITKEAKEVRVTARASLPNGSQEIPLVFKPGGKRVGVGRGSDNELCLPDHSVSKIHAALMMNRDGTLLVADTGSTNGTYINGRRITYGEARQIEEGDVVSFGDIEVRFRKQTS